MLSIEHITKKYGSFTALSDVTLQLDNGVYGLLAPNGAGKTTLIKMIATLLFPDQGQIFWDGNDIFKMGKEYRRLLGYMPQQFGYYRNDTARSFFCYLAALQGIDQKEAEKKADELLALAGLDPHEKKKLKQYSGGMLQRVSIAQALMNDPKLLILDEPTAGLDPLERVRFRNLIRSMARDRIVILSTHIVSDVESIADRIILLKDRTVLCCDTAETITDSVKGKVFEVPSHVTPEESWQFLSETVSASGTMRRYYAESVPAEFNRPEASLEDAFLKIYGGSGL